MVSRRRRAVKSFYRNHDRSRNDPGSGLNGFVDQSDDIGGKSEAVIGFLVVSVVMRSCSGRECAYCGDGNDQCDLEDFHFLFPFSLIYGVHFSLLSDHITLRIFILLSLLLKNP